MALDSVSVLLEASLILGNEVGVSEILSFSSLVKFVTASLKNGFILNLFPSLESGLLREFEAAYESRELPSKAGDGLPRAIAKAVRQSRVTDEYEWNL